MRSQDYKKEYKKINYDSNLQVDGTNNIFVSYKTQIAVLHNASAFIEIIDNPFEYSRTTSRHFLNWLENVLTDSKPTRKDVEKWIRNGSIPAEVNYLNTDIDIRIVITW